MRSSADDVGERRSYRQVARRYAEGEMLAQRQELAELRAERARLCAALERIAAEPDADGADARETVKRLRALARQALSDEAGGAQG